MFDVLIMKQIKCGHNNGSLNHAMVQGEFPGTAGLLHDLIYHAHDFKLMLL